MWAIVVILLSALSGPEAHSVTQAGIFRTEEGCKSAIASAVPGQLEKESAQQFRDGYRRYICVRVANADDFMRPK